MSNGNGQWVTGAILRQRNGTSSAPGTRLESYQSEGNSALARIARRLDVFAKIDDDLQVKTEAGAAVTIGFWMLMIVLVIGEVQAYMRVQPAIERVVVDSTMGQRVRINADIVSAPTYDHFCCTYDRHRNYSIQSYTCCAGNGQRCRVLRPLVLISWPYVCKSIDNGGCLQKWWCTTLLHSLCTYEGTAYVGVDMYASFSDCNSSSRL